MLEQIRMVFFRYLPEKATVTIFGGMGFQSVTTILLRNGHDYAAEVRCEVTLTPRGYPI